METNNNIKDFNIAEALKYAPKELKLYTPMFGEVKFEKIDEGNCVVVRDKYNNLHWFYEYGTYFPLDENNFSEGECLLFPSVNHRCWDNWQNTLFLESIGSVCVHNITGNKFILGEDGTYFGDNTGNSYHFLIDDEDASNYLLNSRYASPEEAVSFIEELEKNGYEWDGEKVVKNKEYYSTIFKNQNRSTSSEKEPIKPKFKVGDVIRHKDTGIFFAIAEVKDDCYYSKGKTCLLFKYQDKWELVGSKANLSLEDKVSILMDEINSIKQDIESLKVSRNQARMRIDSLENWAIENGNPDILEKIANLEKKVTCANVFKTLDKAGDNVTLEEMKG